MQVNHALNIQINRASALELWRYGFPISISIGLLLIAQTGDRLIVGYLRSSAAAGVYAVAYDLGAQAVMMTMMVVSMASYPLAIRALDGGGIGSAQGQLRKNSIVLFGVGLWVTTCLTILSEDVAETTVGKAFRAEGPVILVTRCVEAVISGRREHYVEWAVR